MASSCHTHKQVITLCDRKGRDSVASISGQGLHHRCHDRNLGSGFDLSKTIPQRLDPSSQSFSSDLSSGVENIFHFICHRETFHFICHWKTLPGANLEWRKKNMVNVDQAILWHQLNQCSHIMMTSSNGNIFRVTGPLCGEFTDPGEFPAQRPVTRSFDVFFDLRPNKRLS